MQAAQLRGSEAWPFAEGGFQFENTLRNARLEAGPEGGKLPKAHKTGTTENYASDAGIVKTDQAHYIVALLSNLGTRYAPHERCATTWRLPALGAAVHRLMTSLP